MLSLYRLTLSAQSARDLLSLYRLTLSAYRARNLLSLYRPTLSTHRAHGILSLYRLTLSAQRARNLLSTGEQAERVGGRLPLSARGRQGCSGILISHKTCINYSRKSTPPQNRQPHISISHSKH